MPAREKVRVSDLALSLIRTWVPIGVAAVITWIAVTWGIELPDEWRDGAVAGIVAAVAGGYYYLARRLEQVRGTGLVARAARVAGRWLLGGVVAVPRYERGVRSR